MQLPKNKSSFVLRAHVALKQEMVHFSNAAWELVITWAVILRVWSVAGGAAA